MRLCGALPPTEKVVSPALIRSVQTPAVGPKRGALRTATITGEDCGVLLGVVLPLLAHTLLRQTAGGQLIARVYESYTPAFLQRALRGAGNGLLYLLEHPWLNITALLLTRLVRTGLCLTTLGLDDSQWEHLREAILVVADPQRHFHVLAGLLDLLSVAVRCLLDTLTVSPAQCVAQLASAATRMAVFITQFAANIAESMHEWIGVPYRSTVEHFTVMATTLGMSQFSAAGLVGNVVQHAAHGWAVVNHRAAMANVTAYAGVQMSRPICQIFRDLYSSVGDELGTGVLL